MKTNMKRPEKTALKAKRAQFIGEVIMYGLVGVFSIVILVAGYKMIGNVQDRACKAEIAKFEIDLRDIGKSLRFGAKELKSYDAPCKADKIYFFDRSIIIEPENFKDIPIIKDTLKSGSQNNVFLVKEGEVRRSFYAGNLEMAYPYHICFAPKLGKISFFIEGAGKSARVAAACSQPECTFIPIDITEEESREIIKDAVEFGCRNCPSNLDEEIGKAKLTRQNVEMFRKFTFCEGITGVQVVIRPKKGADVKDFTFYEFIPKNCIDDLGKYLAENIEGNVEIKGDPLIMWYFDDLGAGKEVSYKLSADINDECKKAIQGLGVAQFVKGSQAEERQQAKGQNTAPSISGLPDAGISGTGSDISTFCRKRDRKACAGDAVFWYDSCGNQEEMDAVCPRGEICKDGECKKPCIPDASRKCEDDEKIYWFDSCGKKGRVYYDCRDNIIRNQCRSSECCVGNFFCGTP